MRATALGLAATAIAVHTLRWIIAKKESKTEGESETLSTPASPQIKQDAETFMPSPFRKASFDTTANEDTAPSPSSNTSMSGRKPGDTDTESPLRTEPASSPQLDRSTDGSRGRGGQNQRKALRFQDSCPEGEADPLPDSPFDIGAQPYSSASSDADSDLGPYALNSIAGGAHAAVHVHTPDSSKADSAFFEAFSPKLAGKDSMSSPYGDVSNGWHPTPDQKANMSSGDPSRAFATPSQHSKQPSFPEIDYVPENAGFGSTQDDHFDMAPAPTEEGDAIARVEEVLADLEEQASLGPRRHSRSFSEPNLAAKIVHQQHMQAQAQARVQTPAEDGAQDHSSEEDDTFPTYREESQAVEPDERRGGSHSSLKANGGGQVQSALRESARTARDEGERPPLLRLEILSGPGCGRYLTIDNASSQVTVGRFPDNYLCIEDREVSGKHALINWDSQRWAWQARDMGSMNGTRLNGTFISNAARRPGKHRRLNSDDILLLGSRTAIKIIYLPNAVLPHMPQNLKRLYAPPSGLHPTLTLKSEAMASLRAELNAEKSFQEDGLGLQGSVVCRIGVEHQRMGGSCEDVPFCGETGRYEAALYCVFDGHIGRKSASSCTKLLPEELRKRMAEVRPRLDSGEGVDHVWEEVFLATDAALESTASTEDGCTATALLVWKDAQGAICLQTANVGDSAAVICSSQKDPRTEHKKLTVDHRISDPGEKARLAEMGIELGKNKTRLYGLNLSRCLGDHFIKTADLGFIAVPSISEVVRLGQDESALVVMASDGLWDVAEPGHVMQVAFDAQQQPDSSPESIADAVYQCAMKQRSRDDVCIIVLSLNQQKASS